MWALGETLTVEYATDTLAQYTVAYEPDERHIRAVGDPRLFATRYPSPQPWLPPLAAVDWRPALCLDPYRPRHRRGARDGRRQLALVAEERREEASPRRRPAG